MSGSIIQILVACLVLVGLIFLNVSGILHPVLDGGRIGTAVLTYPLVKVFDKIKNFADFVIDLKRLAAENVILTMQVEKLTSEVAELEKAREENRFLREALGFQTEKKNVLRPCEVIGLDPLSADEKVTLNCGRRLGVTEGAVVVSAGNVLVGVIAQALENTSQMDLLNSSNIAVNAVIVPGGATGLVKGEHGVGLTFDLVSQNEFLKPGDRVVSSGLGGQFPKNLLIGEIGQIRSAKSELFQKASIIPATNLRDLHFVFVIKQ